MDWDYLFPYRGSESDVSAGLSSAELRAAVVISRGFDCGHSLGAQAGEKVLHDSPLEPIAISMCDYAFAVGSSIKDDSDPIRAKVWRQRLWFGLGL